MVLLYVHGRQRECRVPVPQGERYRLMPAPRGRVTRELADELRRALERFAEDAGFTATHPVNVEFRSGIFGHHQVDRAADIYGVDGVGLECWKARWNAGMDAARRAPTPLAARLIREREEKRNFGWRLYKALQRYGRWAQPYGYPVQLFGPWTRSEGPWRCISDFLLHAHRDHVHIAK
jgi:hypothetical protein